MSAGSGKSSSGNTILGENRLMIKKHEFEVCEGKTQIEEKQVHVIDCADLLDPDLNKEKLVSGCSAGLSSVVLTVPLEEPVGNEELVTETFHFFNTCKVKGQAKEQLQTTEGMRMENRGTFIKRSGSMDKLINLSGEDPNEIDVIPEGKDQIHLGKNGCGESTSGNTIVGRNVFESTASTVSQTKPTVRIGREISMIDTPGLYSHETHLSEFG